jgi:hypothetical protein
MRKFWIIYSAVFSDFCGRFYDQQQAVTAMIGLKQSSGRDYYLLEAISYTGSPPQQIDGEKDNGTSS